MSKLNDARVAIERYIAQYRRPDLPPLDSSGLYVLFPDAHVPPGEAVEGRWPEDKWPHADRRGIYMILNRELEVLYVGKASQGPIGGRLAHYFKYNPDRKTCRVVHAGPGGWSSPPIYVVVVAVPDELAFEAAALEEYLIRELQPSDNTLGVVLFDLTRRWTGRCCRR